MPGSDTRRRIALVTSSYHPHVGGVETHVAAVARQLLQQGLAVEVWTVDRAGGSALAEVDGVTVRQLPTPLPARDLGAALRFLGRLPAALAAWRRALRAFRPDVLHVHCFGPNGVYALGLHRLTRVPLVVTSHGETRMDDHGAFEQSGLLRRALRSALQRAVVVTAPSEMVLHDLRERFGLGGRGEVVPNGVDLDLSLEPPDAPAWSGPTVVAVGRLETMKGFDLLLLALSALPRDDVRLVLVGDGSAAAELRSLADELGQSDRLLMPGRRSPEQVAGWMAGADVVVVPSRGEAFGIVVLEAWRATTPVIGTVHGGVREVIRDDVDGLLVDPLDTDALAATIETLLDDADARSRLARAGAERVQDFTWQAVGRAYAGVYASATP